MFDSVMYLQKHRINPNVFYEVYNEIEWITTNYNFGGKVVAMPRLTAWYADSKNLVYTYSGKTNIPRTVWTPSLKALKNKVETATGFTYNSCLANLYRDGRDSVGWHADDEPEVVNSPIASLSLGTSRTFEYRENTGPITNSVLLEHGDILVMMPEFQLKYKHRIPKDRMCFGPRLNLTFRTITI